MSKQILDGRTILVAPGMLGCYEAGEPIVTDTLEGLKLDPRNYSSKLKIYEREVTGWFLEPAQMLLDNDTERNSFIVIMICMSYIEGIEQYKRGESSRSHSREFFISSMNRIFPDIEDESHLVKLYTKTRCGLFHNGMVSGGVLFNNNDFNQALAFENNGDGILINPRLLLQALILDFRLYIDQLASYEQDATDPVPMERENFERMFSIL